MADTLVFIPAWNEVESLPDVLREARRDLPGVDVLVINDGSTDTTAEVARAGGAEVVSFAENRGFAKAWRRGIARPLIAATHTASDSTPMVNIRPSSWPAC